MDGLGAVGETPRVGERDPPFAESQALCLSVYRRMVCDEVLERNRQDLLSRHGASVREVG